MFSVSFAGKAGSAVLSYDGGEFSAVISAAKQSKTVKSPELMEVFRAMRPLLGDRGAMLASRAFVRNMGQALRVMSQQRRAFLHSSKPVFVKIRKAARAGKKAKHPIKK